MSAGGGRVSSLRSVIFLGTTQTLAWASSYYLPAVLAVPIADTIACDTAYVYLCFSLALLVAAVVGPRAGRLIDQRGGRAVLPFTSLLFALGLGLLAAAQGKLSLLCAWLVMGIAMGFGLYDAAFAALVFLYGMRARQAITGITLIAGFASTVGWPLSTALHSAFGWRSALLAWALLHLSLGLLLNRMIPAQQPVDPAAEQPVDPAAQPSTAHAKVPEQAHEGVHPVSLPRHASALLVLSFAATGFVGTAMAAHLPQVLQVAGASLTLAVASGALIGPAQVGARLLQFGPLKHLHPLWSAWLADLAHPLAVLVLMLGGPAASMVFAIVHGMGTGTQTIARGTLPLALFGAAGYGERIGKLLALSRFTQALAPWLFGVALAKWGLAALWGSAALCVLAIAALLPFRTALVSGDNRRCIRPS